MSLEALIIELNIFLSISWINNAAAESEKYITTIEVAILSFSVQSYLFFSGIRTLYVTFK